MKVIECKKCLYTSEHPFGLSFNSEGVCTGCITHQEKFDLNWDERFKLLENRVKQVLYKKNSRRYDCVVPIRGTPEYFYVLDVIINKLGLHPLVVAYNSQFNSIVGIKNLDLIREQFNVDILHYTSNPIVYKKLIRESLVKLDSMRWPFLAGETQFPVQVAVEQNVPLVIWPFHQPTEQVGMHSYTEEAEMSRRSRHEFDLMGYEPQELIGVETLISANDIQDIIYPSNIKLYNNKIIGIYLGNYIPWDTRKFSEEMIVKYGAHAAKNLRTFDTYDRIDDKTYMAIHDVIKFNKHNYSRVTDNLCREIRFGRISKEDAKVIEKFYQQEYPKQEIKYFLDWLGMKEPAFDWFIKRMPKYQKKSDSEKIVLTKKQLDFINSFVVNHPNVHEKEGYIIYGKGLFV